MVSEDLRRFLAPQFRILKIIWFAMQAAVAIYWFLTRVLSRGWEDAGPADASFAWVFWALAAAVGGASLIHQRWAFSEARLEHARRTRPRPNSFADGIFARDGGFADLDPFERGLADFFTHLQTRYIVTWAMQEAVAVFGLVQAVVTRDAANMAIFCLAAWALIVTTRPRVEPYLQWAARRPV